MEYLLWQTRREVKERSKRSADGRIGQSIVIQDLISHPKIAAPDFELERRYVGPRIMPVLRTRQGTATRCGGDSNCERKGRGEFMPRLFERISECRAPCG